MKKLIFLLFLSSNICSNRLHSMHFGTLMPHGVLAAGALSYNSFSRPLLKANETSDTLEPEIPSLESLPDENKIILYESIFDPSNFQVFNNLEGETLKLQLARNIVYHIYNGDITLQQIPHTKQYLTNHLTHRFKKLLKENLWNTKFNKTSLLFSKIPNNTKINDDIQLIFTEALNNNLEKIVITRDVFKDFLNYEIPINQNCELIKSLHNDKCLILDSLTKTTQIQNYFFKYHGKISFGAYIAAMVLFTYSIHPESYDNSDFKRLIALPINLSLAKMISDKLFKNNINNTDTPLERSFMQTKYFLTFATTTLATQIIMKKCLLKTEF